MMAILAVILKWCLFTMCSSAKSKIFTTPQKSGKIKKTKENLRKIKKTMYKHTAPTIVHLLDSLTIPKLHFTLLPLPHRTEVGDWVLKGKPLPLDSTISPRGVGIFTQP
ncbi:MAG: hypothetical protein ACRCVL_03015 [Cetobacterium sp.]